MITDPRQIRRLLVVSHVRHYRHQGRLYAYSPYVRELQVWADLFPSVVLASPCLDEVPPGDSLPLDRSNIAMAPQLDTGGDTWTAKVRQLLLLPRLIYDLCRAMRRADAIHVRCPGNLGLLGCLLAPLFSPFLVAKFAGQWNRYSGEPWTYRLQRALLGCRWWHGPVTVYGQWPNQPGHVLSWFASVLDREQLARARRAVDQTWDAPPLRLLYVGRLCPAKQIDTLVTAVAMLVKQNLPIHCTLVGEGLQRNALERQIAEHGLHNHFTMVGGLPFSEVLNYYERSHVLVLVSQTEGWPKAVLEAMAFGLVCIGSDRGLLPEILGQGRGLIVPLGNAEALAAAIRQIAEHPGRYQSLRHQAAAWAQQYTLESLGQALRTMLSLRWHTSIGEASVPSTTVSATR